MASSSQNPAPALSEGPAGKRTWFVSMTSLIFIVLQSACTAVIAISGVRVAIGLSALAETTIGIHAPAVGPKQRRSEFLQNCARYRHPGPSGRGVDHSPDGSSGSLRTPVAPIPRIGIARQSRKSAGET
jgi:hypothetical protein